MMCHFRPPLAVRESQPSNNTHLRFHICQRNRTHYTVQNQKDLLFNANRIKMKHIRQSADNSTDAIDRNLSISTLLRITPFVPVTEYLPAQQYPCMWIPESDRQNDIPEAQWNGLLADPHIGWVVVLRMSSEWTARSNAIIQTLSAHIPSEKSTQLNRAEFWVVHTLEVYDINVQV
jgi:hypothetical protein